MSGKSQGILRWMISGNPGSFKRGISRYVFTFVFFLWRNMENYPQIISVNPSYLEHLQCHTYPIFFGQNYLKNKNSVDLDQTAPKEQSDQGLHCLLFCLFL